VEGQSDRTVTSSDGSPGDPEPSEDERAREMIVRISRQVDLEMGRVPLGESEEAPEEGDANGEPDEPGEVASAEQPPPDAPEAEAADAPAVRSEEDVSRELVERVAREVDQERHG